MNAPVSLRDLERAARSRLPRDIWDFISGGSGQELTLAANEAAFERIHLVPRVLRDVSQRTTSSRLLGTPASLPLAVAPMAYQRLLHEDGEEASAAAAKEAGVPFTAPTLSSVPLERITATGATTWFQLYWLRDRGLTHELVRRAEEAGCTALMLTVDVPWMGNRLRDVRNGFTLPPAVHAANLPAEGQSTAHRSPDTATGSALAVHTRTAFDPSLSWSDLEDLRSRTRLPLIVKGVLDPEDAALAARHGADGLVVSNHGGRQLDGALPAIDALDAVCQAAGDTCEVLLDSGVRSGTDILKALATGASGVLVGRPLLWGLAAGGRTGAREALALLAAELDHALGLAGCASPADARHLRTVTSQHPGRPRLP